MNFHRIFLAAFIAQNCFAMNQQNNQMQNNYIIENNHLSGEQSHGNNNVIQRIISREDHLQGAEDLATFSDQVFDRVSTVPQIVLEQRRNNMDFVLAQSGKYQQFHLFYLNRKQRLSSMKELAKNDMSEQEKKDSERQIENEELVVCRLEDSVKLFKDFAQQKSLLAEPEKYEAMLMSWIKLRAYFCYYIIRNKYSMRDQQKIAFQKNVGVHLGAMNTLKNDMDSLGKSALPNNENQKKFTFSVKGQIIKRPITVDENKSSNKKSKIQKDVE